MAAATKNTKLTPVYLLRGDDELKRKTALDRLRSRLEKTGDLALNSETIDAAKTSASDIIAACNTLPFASDWRLVVANNVEKLSQQDTDELLSYFQNPCTTTILMLVAPTLKQNSRLYKAVKASYPKSIIECGQRSSRDLPKLVSNMARSYGVTMSERAARLLIELVGTSTTHLDNEVHKLAFMVPDGKRTIDETDVACHVARVAEVKPWELPDALSARDAETALSIARVDGHPDPTAMLFQCCKRLRELIAVRTLDGRGTPEEIPKAIGRKNLKDWQLKRYRSWAARYDMDELRQALVSASEVDRLMKSGTDQQVVFETWLLATCKGVTLHLP